MTNSQSQNKKPFPENVPIEVYITAVDTSSLALYNIVRFYLIETEFNGIILEKKSSIDKFISGHKMSVQLCDIGQYQDIFRASDTTSIGNVPIIYSGQEGLTDNVDTITLRGHFMINGRILIDHKLILDFADDAIEPVFELCGK